MTEPSDLLSVAASLSEIANAIDRLAVVLAENNEATVTALEIGVVPMLNELVGEVQSIKDTMRGHGPTLMP